MKRKFTAALLAALVLTLTACGTNTTVVENKTDAVTAAEAKAVTAAVSEETPEKTAPDGYILHDFGDISFIAPEDWEDTTNLTALLAELDSEYTTYFETMVVSLMDNEGDNNMSVNREGRIDYFHHFTEEYFRKEFEDTDFELRHYDEIFLSGYPALDIRLKDTTDGTWLCQLALNADYYYYSFTIVFSDDSTAEKWETIINSITVPKPAVKGYIPFSRGGVYLCYPSNWTDNTDTAREYLKEVDSDFAAVLIFAAGGPDGSNIIVNLSVDDEFDSYTEESYQAQAGEGYTPVFFGRGQLDGHNTIEAIGSTPDGNYVYQLSVQSDGFEYNVTFTSAGKENKEIWGKIKKSFRLL